MPSVLTLWRSVGKKLLMEVMIFLLAKIIILTIISIVTWQRTGACQASCYVTLKQRTPHPTSFFIGVIIVAMCGRHRDHHECWHCFRLFSILQFLLVSSSLIQSPLTKGKTKTKWKRFKHPMYAIFLKCRRFKCMRYGIAANKNSTKQILHWNFP